MELDELHIAHYSSSQKCHGDPCSGDRRMIGCGRINPSDPAACEDDVIPGVRMYHTRFILCSHSGNPSITIFQKMIGHLSFDDLHIFRKG